MKKEIPENTFIVLAFFVLLASCGDRKIILPDLPYLVADSAMHFKVGDRFILATSVNSCCQYFWLSGKDLIENVPEIELLKL